MLQFTRVKCNLTFNFTIKSHNVTRIMPQLYKIVIIIQAESHNFEKALLYFKSNSVISCTVCFYILALPSCPCSYRRLDMSVLKTRIMLTPAALDGRLTGCSHLFITAE